MRYYFENIWITISYYAEELLIRLKYELDKDPFAFKARVVLISIILLTIVSSLFFTLNQPDNTSSDPPPSQNLYQVVSIIGGDTIKANVDGTVESIRIIGLDTPETKKPGSPVECFGPEASSRMQHYVQSKKVMLESDPSQAKRDKYGRLLSHVFLEDGTNVALQMIKEGYALEYTYGAAYKYQSAFIAAEAHARDTSAGLWSPLTCDGNTQQPSDSSATQPHTSQLPTDPSLGLTEDCDPNYIPCIPYVPYDLDCADIPTSVQVIGTDRHRFDKEGDRRGCETN